MEESYPKYYLIDFNIIKKRIKFLKMPGSFNT
jgi:hypothetical protein